MVAAPAVHPVRARWIRFGIKSSGAWIFCVALIAGWWPLVAVAAGAGLLVLLGLLPVLFGRPALHDRAAGTAWASRGG